MLLLSEVKKKSQCCRRERIFGQGPRWEVYVTYPPEPEEDLRAMPSPRRLPVGREADFSRAALHDPLDFRVLESALPRAPDI